MPTIGLYTATENELGAIQAATAQLDGIDLVVRSESDLDDPMATETFLDDLTGAAAAIFWLHGSEQSMPGYERAIDRLCEANVPVVVKSTGDAFARADTTVSPRVHEGVSTYLERGGTTNVANCIRYLADAVGFTQEYDEPVTLPTEGVYHPDHPGISFQALRATFDPDRPTIGIWFYESHWTHENTRYVDALVRAIEARGADALAIFCNPVTDSADQHDAEWVTENWLLDDHGEPIVDCVCSSFMFSLSMAERGRAADDEGDSLTELFLERLGVPVLQTITTMRSRSRYQSSDAGVMGFELALSVALPEFDGTVITHPISGKEATTDSAGIGSAPKQHFPIEDRIDHAAELAVNWATLRRTPPEEKRIAVVLHNYPPSDDGIGTAFGLDTPESTVNLLETLDKRGYDLGDAVPTDGSALIDRLIQQLTLDGRWVDPADVRSLSVDVVEPEQYADWFERTDDRFQAGMLEEWGDPPARPFAIPGVEFSNVLVTIQPPRGFGMDPSKVYHDSDLWPPHDYLAFYGWLRHEFDAHAVVHCGTHGSLEWLPGKTVGLDGASAPDQLVGALPNVYPYIINNPGEGTQATRRSYATIVDYLTPVMTDAGTYDELSTLEELADQFREPGMETARSDDGAELATLLREHVEEQNLGPELCPDGTPVASLSTETLVERIHEYLTDVKTTQIRMGLHTMGEPPAGERLVEFIAALTRLENAGGPSLHKSVAGVLGIDYDRLRNEPSTYDATLGTTYANAADIVSETAHELVATLAAAGFQASSADDAGLSLTELVASVDPLGEGSRIDGAPERLHSALSFICQTVAPRLQAASAELDRTADALDGEYVPPGGSGAPTRGGVDLLPTGRNFYTLDPRKVPAQSAWRVGRELAAGVLDQHLESTGAYPETVGVVAWGTPTVRTRGETIAKVLALMGVRPVWTDAGRVEAVEPIELDSLGRPRIDVTTRVSGLFRDAFPQAASVIHDAVETVCELDEPHEMNYVKKHVETEAEQLDAEGVDDPHTAASHRVFTTRPGGYGAGTNKAVDEGNWEDQGDLADVYVQWGGYALDNRGRVSGAHEAFKRRLRAVEATVKIEDTAEQDEFDSSDWYAFHGGFITAVTNLSGSEPASYVGDSSDPDAITVYTNEQKVRKAMRARVLNPEWIDSMTEHGYKGGGDLSTTVDVVFGWDATTDVISDHLWTEVTEAYALHADRQEWFREENPWALASIAETILDAIDRGLFDASDEIEDALENIPLSVEGEIERRSTPAGELP